jgi:hypothetical protein
MSLNRTAVATWIPGYAYATDDITIDITATGGLGAKGLTGAEAHATTGDVAEIVRCMLECIYQNNISVPAAERLQNFRISKSSSIDSATDNVELSYTIRFVAEPVELNVAAEPVEE